MKTTLKLFTTVNCYDAKMKKYEAEIEINMCDTGHSFNYELLNKWIRETIDDKAVMVEEVGELIMHHLNKIIDKSIPIEVIIKTNRNPFKHINVKYSIKR